MGEPFHDPLLDWGRDPVRPQDSKRRADTRGQVSGIRRISKAHLETHPIRVLIDSMVLLNSYIHYRLVVYKSGETGKFPHLGFVNSDSMNSG